jgi:hypothetical protein
MYSPKSFSKSSPRFLARRALPLALTGVLLIGCSQDTVAPQNEISAEARVDAAARTTEILSAEQLSQRATAVEDLVGGFGVGIAGETAGLDMEIGTSINGLAPVAARISLGQSVSDATTRARQSQKQLAQIHDTRLAKMAAAAPGDLLYEETVTNPDGSQTHTRVFQDSPESVVRVLQETTWPQGKLLLRSISAEIFVDRGADLGSETDDRWLRFSNAIEFINGARLERLVDAREQGGLQDFQRVDVVSTWTPRPGHPRLLDSVTTLTVDLNELAVATDDRFVSVNRVTRMLGTAFDGGAPRVVESLTPESPIAEGEEPCGGEISRDVYFRSDRSLRRWTDRATWACSGGGSLSRSVTHANGGVDQVTITEGSDGIVYLDASNQDGTTVSGSYDDALHEFSLSVAHPEGSDPVRETLSGSTNEDETAWQLDAEVFYADGFIETGHLEGSEDSDGKHLSGNFSGRDESVSFQLDSSLDETRLEGHIENDQQQQIDFVIEQLPDGGSLVHFDASEPGLRVVGDLEIDADGCGEGTLEITEGDNQVTIDVSFCDGDLDDGELANF